MPEAEVNAGTFWWLEAGTDRSIETRDSLKAILDNKVTFNITQDDHQFLNENKNNPDVGLAFYDKVCSQGWILVQAPPDRIGLVVCFWIEDYSVYDRLAQWFRSRGLKKGMLLLRELSSMRGWEQPIESLLAMKQFSKDPSTHVSCQNCGYNLSHSELIEKRVCPKCGLELA